MQVEASGEGQAREQELRGLVRAGGGHVEKVGHTGSLVCKAGARGGGQVTAAVVEKEREGADRIADPEMGENEIVARTRRFLFVQKGGQSFAEF